MQDTDIIFFSGIEWHGQNKMPCHHLVDHLAERHRVFYINNFGALRDLDFNDFSRCWSKLTGLLKGRKNPHSQVAKSCKAVHVWQPWIVPTPRIGLIQKINSWLLRRSLRRLCSRYSIVKPILWTRLPTPIVWQVIQNMKGSRLIYQSIDKFPEHPRIPESLRESYRKSENLFNQHADLVFCSARGLYEEKHKYNLNTYFLPNSVSATFSEQKVRRIEYMEAIDGPIVGFAGALGTATDINLLCALAETLHEVNFVFLGTIDRTDSVDTLERLPNVYFMGLVPHGELMSWFQYFDLGLMPYELNHYQDYTFPSKLAEYLMAGLPIVATRLPELEAYAEVVDIADSASTMIHKIKLLLASDSRRVPDLFNRRRELANVLTWEAQVAKVESELEALEANTK